MRDSRMKSDPSEGTRDIQKTSGGEGTTIIQSFGKETPMQGYDASGRQEMQGTLRGDKHDLSHSITSGRVTGTPTTGTPHKTKTAV